MTVRVTKPEFNLREKISELDKPTGLKGSELMRSETPQEARDSIGLGPSRKNLFINGDMRIDQRSNGAASTPASTGFSSVDRWKAVIYPYSKFAMQRKNDASLPHFPFYMRLTVTTALTSMGSSQYQLFWQTIESKNIFDRTGFGSGKNAKDLTLSFWVRSNVAGPFSGSLENWSQNRAFVWEVDIKNINTWEYKTVHIPPCTDGDWNISASNRGAYFMFSLGTTLGSEPNVGWVAAQRLGSSTDIRRIGIQGCTVDITGCQLEIGRVATEFNHTSFTEELSLCERYYQNSFMEGNSPGTSTAMGDAVITTSWGDGNAPGPNPFRTAMRAAPAVVLRARGSTTTGQVNHNGSNVTASAQQIGTKGIAYIETGSGASAYAFNAYTFELDAEI